MVNEQDARELFEVLSPYQVAVMAFTSPAEINPESKTEAVTLTSKESYVWAAAVAYILAHRPRLSQEQVLGYLRIAIEQSGRAYANQVLARDLGSLNYVASGIPLVDSFLRSAGFNNDVLKEASRQAEDAIRSLEWLGVIEDPIRKKILGFLLAVYAIAGPVNFSSAGPNDFRYATMTWQVSAAKDPKTDQTRFDFNLKVHRIAEAVKDELIPALGKVIDEAASLNENDPDQKMSTEELQSRLKDLGYYDGSVDGKPWQRTYSALKRFQQDRHLKVTGYPDADTVRALRESKRW